MNTVSSSTVDEEWTLLKDKVEETVDHVSRRVFASQGDEGSGGTSIAKLLDRFRNAEPMDKKDRPSVKELFWWNGHGHEEADAQEEIVPTTKLVEANAAQEMELISPLDLGPISTITGVKKSEEKFVSPLDLLNAWKNDGDDEQHQDNGDDDDDDDDVDDDDEIDEKEKYNDCQDLEEEEEEDDDDDDEVEENDEEAEVIVKEEVFVRKERRRVYVFWDVENLAIPSGKDPFSVAQMIRTRANELGKEVWPDFEGTIHCRIVIFHNPLRRTLTIAQRKGLVSAFATLVDIGKDKAGMADLVIKEAIHDMMKDFGPEEVLTILISSDSDFVSTIRLLGDNQYKAVCVHRVLHPNKIVANMFDAFAWRNYDWEEYITNHAVDIPPASNSPSNGNNANSADPTTSPQQQTPTQNPQARPKKQRKQRQGKKQTPKLTVTTQTEEMKTGETNDSTTLEDKVSTLRQELLDKLNPPERPKLVLFENVVIEQDAKRALDKLKGKIMEEISTIQSLKTNDPGLFRDTRSDGVPIACAMKRRTTMESELKLIADIEHLKIETKKLMAKRRMLFD